MTAIDSSFDLFSLTDEHHELRSAIRALTERDIVPHAADCDENERFPSEALDALNQSGFNAVHIPEAYDGQGADAVATCIVIEEVARGCCSSSLIPAVNKLGTMGLILSGSEELKQQVLADRTLVEPARHLADETARAGQPTWLYRFAYVSQAQRGTWQVADAVAAQPWLPNGPIPTQITWTAPHPPTAAQALNRGQIPHHEVLA